jgi:hypothetical protein
MMPDNPPPPFIIGATYADEISEYKILSVEGARMTFERPDGSTKHTNDIPLKATIHNRIAFERQNPKPLNYQRTTTARGASEYAYADVMPLVADVIDKHSEQSKEYMPHDILKRNLLLDPHAGSIIRSLGPTPTCKTPEARAGEIIAGFSKEWMEGRWGRFEREKQKNRRGNAWRVKSG